MNNQKRQVGGQPKNTNNLRHGGRSARLFPVSALGKKHASVTWACRRLQRFLENLAQDKFGAITVETEGQIAMVCRFAGIARLTDRLLRDNPDMPPSEAVSTMKTGAWAMQQVVGRLAKLGLDGHAADGGDVWAALDATQHATRPATGSGEVSITEGSNNATHNAVGDVAADEGQGDD